MYVFCKKMSIFLLTLCDIVCSYVCIMCKNTQLGIFIMKIFPFVTMNGDLVDAQSRRHYKNQSLATTCIACPDLQGRPLKIFVLDHCINCGDIAKQFAFLQIPPRTKRALLGYLL